MIEGDLSGNLNSIDFVWEARDEIDSLRRRYLAINFQILFGIIVLSIFLRNAYRAGFVVSAYPRKLAPWCCLTINLTGIMLFVLIGFPSLALGSLSCHILIWAIIVGATFSLALTNVVLFERAYLACGRPRWFLIIGIILIIVPGPIYITIVQYSSTSRYSEIHGCYIQYKSYLPYARIALDLPSNIIFSAIFLMVIYRHYKRYQEACWKKLAKDGVITMLLVVASNMLCFIINATEVIKENGDLLYIVDWAIAATLLVNNIYNLHMLPESYTATKPRTKPTTTSKVSIEDQTTTRNRFGVTGITTTYIFE